MAELLMLGRLGMQLLQLMGVNGTAAGKVPSNLRLCQTVSTTVIMLKSVS